MLGGISIWQLLIVLVIVIMIFGTKKLRGMGSDLGGAVKGFKKAMNDDDKAANDVQHSVEHKEASDELKNQDSTKSDAQFAEASNKEKE